MRLRRWFVVGILAAGLGAMAQAPLTLREAYAGDFHIGAAINTAQITGQDARGDAILLTQFDSISPENVLKWEVVHPQPGKYDFTLADRYVTFGAQHRMWTVGHNLVWHSQVPAWVFRDEKGNLLTRDALLARMHDHIATVVGRYKGRIQSWDVVNEALNEDGTLRQDLWEKIIGDDYIAKAFDVLPPAMGAQTADVSVNIAGNAKLNPWPHGLPDTVQEQLAARYAELFRVYVANKASISRVTFWGVTDGDSWKNDWPVRGRTDYPLLFGRDGETKPAFAAVVEAAR